MKVSAAADTSAASGRGNNLFFYCRCRSNDGAARNFDTYAVSNFKSDGGVVHTGDKTMNPSPGNDFFPIPEVVEIGLMRFRLFLLGPYEQKVKNNKDENKRHKRSDAAAPCA